MNEDAREPKDWILAGRGWFGKKQGACSERPIESVGIFDAAACGSAWRVQCATRLGVLLFAVRPGWREIALPILVSGDSAGLVCRRERLISGFLLKWCPFWVAGF